MTMTCSCYVGGSTEGDPPGMSKREAAKGAVRTWELMRDLKKVLMREHVGHPVRLRQGIFGRWFILHEKLDDAARSGSRWVSVSENGMPTGGVQVCNFATEDEAAKYALEHGMTLSIKYEG